MKPWQDFHIFIHGTGVREQDYEQNFALIKNELIERDSSLDVLPCYWGHLGTQLNASGASVPEYNSTHNVNEESLADDEYLISLWGIQVVV